MAAVLLAIGVGGCLGALATSLRMRNGAAAREVLAAAAHDRLTWFESSGCAVQDTLIAVAEGAGNRAAESWQVAAEPSAVTLRGVATKSGAGVSFSLQLDTRRACE